MSREQFEINVINQCCGNCGKYLGYDIPLNGLCEKCDKKQIKIVKATSDNHKSIVKFIDRYLVGYGFVTSSQLLTEIEKGRVWIAVQKDNLLGVRVGTDTLFNLVVHPEYRKKGIGKMLIEIYRPDKIRVKAIPVGHLSKKQKDEFTDPRKFYENLEYQFSHDDYGRNFYAGGTDDNRRLLYKHGKEKHIKVYIAKDPRQKRLF